MGIVVRSSRLTFTLRSSLSVCPENGFLFRGWFPLSCRASDTLSMTRPDVQHHSILLGTSRSSWVQICPSTHKALGGVPDQAKPSLFQILDNTDGGDVVTINRNGDKAKKVE